MQLRDTLTIGIVALLSTTMMSGEPESPAPSLDPPLTETQILTQLQAMVQEPPPPVRNGVKVTLHRHGPSKAVTLTPEFVDECMEVAEQINPQWASSIRGLCEKNPEEFERFIRQSGRRLMALVQLKQKDPDLYETKLSELRIEAQILAATQELRKLHSQGLFDSSEADRLKTELRGMVQNHVAYSLKTRGDNILRLKKHIMALEKQLEQDALNFFRSVEDRYQTLLEMP